MALNVSYGEILEMSITEEEAGKVYSLLLEGREREGEDWKAQNLRVRSGSILQAWHEAYLEGQESTSIARRLIQARYREMGKSMVFGPGHVVNPYFEELKLDLFAAVGIEPPLPDGPPQGHGSR